MASPELLSGLKGYQMGGRDARGSIISDGSEFTYVDWDGPPVWRVYEERDGRYEVMSEHETEAAALAAAAELAGA